MKVLSAGVEETRAYTRVMWVEVEGVEYRVNVFWDEQDGYSTSWFIGSEWITEPESVSEEAEKENLSTGYYLELMAEEAKV